jgi:pimeloyl-ACP methyl ester carboxylesterase
LNDQYDWPGGREAMLRFGPGTGPVVIAVMPLFEEANRTRAFMVTMLRALADHGIAGVLPDLPGTGESLTETEDVTLSDWVNALSALVETVRSKRGEVHGIALRGGTLIDAPFDSRWHFAPVTGESLVRDLLRTRLTTGKDSADDAIELSGPPVELAGNRLSRTLLAQLKATVPGTAERLRIVRLETDTRPADRHFAGSPLWRRSEPDNDPALALLLADDIATWIASCGA